MWHWSHMCRDAAGMVWVLAAICWLKNWPVLF